MSDDTLVQRQLVYQLTNLKYTKERVTGDIRVYVELEDGELRNVGEPRIMDVNGMRVIVLYAGTPMGEDV